MLPENDREAFDVRPVVDLLADADSVIAGIYRRSRTAMLTVRRPLSVTTAR